MSLQYAATAQENPFANIGDESPNSAMLPLCLRGRAMLIQFTAVSTEARATGIQPGTPLVIQFAPHNNTYALSFQEGEGAAATHSYGYAAWSPAQHWAAVQSGGQNTRQAELDLGTGVWPGHFKLTCVAQDKNMGQCVSNLGTATFQIINAA